MLTRYRHTGLLFAATLTCAVSLFFQFITLARGSHAYPILASVVLALAAIGTSVIVLVDTKASMPVRGLSLVPILAGIIVLVLSASRLQ